MQVFCCILLSFAPSCVVCQGVTVFPVSVDLVGDNLKSYIHGCIIPGVHFAAEAVGKSRPDQDAKLLISELSCDCQNFRE